MMVMLELPDPLAVQVVPGDGTYHVCSWYAEQFWLPVIGPSALWAARHIVRRYDTGSPIPVDLADLSAAIGLGHADRPISRTLSRLAAFGWASWDGTLLKVADRHRRLSEAKLRRLPAFLRDEHERLTAAQAGERELEVAL